jgi:hypothetical protein
VQKDKDKHEMSIFINVTHIKYYSYENPKEDETSTSGSICADLRNACKTATGKHLRGTQLRNLDAEEERKLS